MLILIEILILGEKQRKIDGRAVNSCWLNAIDLARKFTKLNGKANEDSQMEAEL